MEVTTPHNTKGTKKEQVRDMFNNIAHRYDFLNHFLSLGIDKMWRRKTIKEISKVAHSEILDVATGTADLAIEAVRLNPKSITGIDISEKMLSIGRKKVADKKLENIISLQIADSEKLPFEDAKFDAAMVAFGIRNFQNLEEGLHEMRRVVRDKGCVFILEFSRPEKFPVKQFYSFYSRFLLPFWGKLFSGDNSAYSYLPESIKNFPSGKELETVLLRVGYSKVKIMPLTFGIVTLYVASV
ncbi:MAG: bifunctional demethylmenaquinone methyltransferase/2-methoxy-6-polyprenyl-1,4-benzoquinol methylase UbiE [Bacteroidetes bacterium]|nr:bifunctional demethylmenaquinone methyltransferase/2-methoxy-6-polyprenyl-1,4-benzoquinol methylase UbiE [Bacteroidota bacterium]